MATLFSPSALLSTATTSSSSSTPQKPQPKPQFRPLKPLSTSLTAAAAAAAVILSVAPPSLADSSSSPSLNVYYGTAASAANYGGYGGNASKRDSAEYTYLVPEGWKERLVSKVEKGTNGTDSEFYNPRRRSEREYLTFLPGIRGLAPVDAVLSNLALSDVGLQDQIASAEEVRSEEKRKGDQGGQVYYAYEVEGAGAHSLISVTCARNKLYAHFVTAPAPDWSRDEAMLRQLHESFKTIVDPDASS